MEGKQRVISSPDSVQFLCQQSGEVATVLIQSLLRSKRICPRYIEAQQVNIRVFQHAKVEFEWMYTYMYLYSDSPIASPLVVAPKATKPFIRLYGDYRWVNQYVRTAQYYIPHVVKELEKAD